MLSKILKGTIHIYRRCISPILPPGCRYMPTCSEYAQEALEKHGVILGIWLTTKRLFRCHPWGGHGFDPVPDSKELASVGCGCPTHPNKGEH